MKRSNILMIVITCMMLVGCGQNDSDTIANTPGIDGSVTGQGSNDLINLAPTADEIRICNSLRRPTTYLGTWQKNAIGENSDVTMTLDIRQGRVALTNTCMFRDGRSVTAQVSARAQFVGYTLVIQQDARDVRMAHGSRMSCSAQLRAKTVVLRERGGCLDLDVLSPTRSLFMPTRQVSLDRR